MVLRTHIFSINEFYHLYSRGVDKRVFFLSKDDEDRFVRLLYICNGTKPVAYKNMKDLPLLSIEKGENLVAIGSYCLMGNHFHLLVKEIQEGGISKFMKKLLTAYSSYFNKKYGRTGSLFESSYKSQHLNSDEYLKYVFSYIHLNPMKIIDKDWKNKALDKVAAENFLKSYHSSSYLDYAGIDREISCILNKLAFPEYFPNPDVFNKEIIGWLGYPHLS